MNTEHHSRIADRILQKVHAGDVRMHSRVYFVVRLVLSIVVAVATLVVSALVLSFIFFSIRQSGQFFLLGLGFRGIQTFILLFPWTLLAADLALIVFLEWLLQGFKLGYRISVLALLFYVVLGSVALGAVVEMLPIHSALLQRADRGELPLIGDLYENVHSSHHDQGIFRGTVVSSMGPTTTITRNDNDRDIDDSGHNVVVSSTTQLDAPLQAGDSVYIFGTESDGTVQAAGIRHISDDQY